MEEGSVIVVSIIHNIQTKKKKDKKEKLRMDL
jgi:hypothetical protein